MSDDCLKHKKDVQGISDMKVLAEMIGDLHYESLESLLYFLYKKLDADAENDYKGGKENLASDLQYLSMSIFESYLRAGKVWQISTPFMESKTNEP